MERNNRMKYSESLKKTQDFRRVYRTRKSKANACLVMYVRENHLGKNRIGISVSKKVGNSVVRHHVTRLIRESYRLMEDSFSVGYDVVFVARVHTKDCAYFEIERAMKQLAGRHHLLEEKNEETCD